MRKLYSSLTCRNFFVLLTLLLSVTVTAQTTLTTLPNPPYDGGNGAGTNTAVTFVVENTNPFPILLNNVSTWLETTDINSTLQLWYSATSLSGLPAFATPTWTMINQRTGIPTPGADGITPIWTNLGFTIPAGTQYRFAVWYVNVSSHYSGTGAGTVTPSNFSGAGVNLKLGDVQIAGANVGYGGANNPRWWTGAIGFAPAGPCVNPPVPGTISSTVLTPCLGVPFTLSLNGGTGGTGQTYQWEISNNNITFTPIAGATGPTLTASQTSTNYYRVVVTCGVPVTSSSIQLTTAAAVSGTYTINNILPPSATNFISFNAAYDFIKCGINGDVVFNVDPLSGPYNEQLIMNDVPGASAVNTITFNGNGRVITFNSTTTGQRGVIKLDGADHITFNNLTINAPGTLSTEFGYGVHLINDADSNTINNCSININTTSTSTNYAGIAVSSSHTSATAGSALCDGNIFSNNTITGGYYGITLNGSNTVAVQNNQIVKNTIKEFYFYGVYVTGSFNTLIDSNLINRPTRTTVSTFNGIYFTGLSVSAKVTRNTITNPFGGATTSTGAMNGIYFTAVDALGGLNNIVTNNLMYNFTGSGIISAMHNASSDNVLYYHNTINLDGEGTGIARAFYQTTQAGGIAFQNNIISVTRTGTGAKYALYYNTTTSDIVSKNNDLFISPTATNAFTGFFTSARLTLADWQLASGDDASSVSTNPIFQDVASGNYRPTNASIDNLGTPQGVLIDIVGVTRNVTTPDLGAYEFTPGACVTPPIPGIATVNNTPVCFNVNVSLNLSANSIGTGQTYQWQSSATLAGPYTSFSAVLTNPELSINSTTTLYYRVAVTCSGNTTFSTPVLLTVNPPLAGGTYTIGGAPSTTNFANFNEAKAAMACGIADAVVINVVAGTGPYNEQLILDSIPGSSATKTITFNGNNNVIAFSSNINEERAVIKFNGADHITFNNLIIDATGTGTYGFGVQLINNADSNRIDSCTILANTTSTSVNYAGIVMNASATGAVTTGNTLCDGNVFSNNSVKGGYYSITMVGSNTSAVRENQVINNTLQDFYLYGVYLNGNFKALIEGNNISRPLRTNVSTFYGVYVTALNVNVSISKNRIHNPYGGELDETTSFYGTYFTGVDALSGLENVVSNNIVYNVNGEGTQYGHYNTSSDNVQYYYNTVSLQDNANTSTNATHGFYQTTLAGGIDFRNNLIAITRSGSGEKSGIVFNTSTSTITSDFNNIFITPGVNSYIGSIGTTDYATLPLWQTASGGDDNSLTTNPFFTSAATGNLKPQSVVMDNQGTPIPGITTDIENTTRSSTTPDIGAYEYSVPPCTAPPVAGNATASPNSGICLGASINLALTAATSGSGQTYQWQFSTTAAGPYTNLGGVMQFADTTILATTTLYYRASVTCNGNTTFSTPVLVTINPAFLSGVYTINPATPPFYPAPGSVNFPSFTAAVAALECGITGFVTFNVAPGIYTEQVRMHAIAGTSPTSRVTFQSANGSSASVNLTFDATLPAANYTLKLDSASYVTYKNMTITATNTTNGRAIELANTASFDSLLSLNIVSPISTGTVNTSAGIYADLFRGSNNVIKGNSILNGSSGIYFEGTAAANLTYDNVIDSNSVSGSYTNNIYIGFNGRVTVKNNNVVIGGPRAATSYGIYSTNTDSAFIYTKNEVTINNVTSANVYGMYFTGSNARAGDRGTVASNRIIATSGNTGNLYGMYHTGTLFADIVNNVISVNTSGATSYGSYSTGSGGNTFYNNTVVSTATSATNNVAAYFAQTSGANPSINIRNNIFSHFGGGRAMYVTNLNFIYSDYNTFYTTGTSLIQWNTTNYATLQQWIDAAYWDVSSISIQPAFVSNTDPRPDLASPDVWAIHGRGTQITGNTYDFNNNPRPATFTTGVPDMGAYEFLPTSLPTLLIPTPATPAPGITQTFMYGTDIVAKVTYDPTAPVPASINLRRYSGVLPPGLSAGQQAMYFYTDIDVPAQGAYKYTMQQFYIDPWRGFIPSEHDIKMGRTNAAGVWEVSAPSTVDIDMNVIRDTGVVLFDKYTGLAGVPTVPTLTSYINSLDTSNRGKRFWVPYGHHYSFSTNAQDMWLYLSAQDSANVTIRVNGTNWSKSYAIPANTVKVSDLIPKYGLIDARITDEGLFERGISITSDVPIVAYAHIYDGATSGASMLLPVGVYGYEYQSLNARQYYPTGGAGSYSWFSVISDRDSTLVQITPSVTTKAGRPAGVPFTVLLMRGEVYNVMGTINGATGTDLSGSTIKSIANSNGKCYPIAVFSGSSRTAICNTTNGDNMIQQVFPSQAWGKKYLTFATARSTSNTQYNSNIFRVMVKDPTTVVTVNNGPALTGLVVPGNYYEFNTTAGTGANGAIYVNADKPVMVAQYMVSTGANSCPGVTATGDGDPEMIYISPIEQGIKKAVFYNTDQSDINSNYVNIVIPTAGLTSLRIDGAATFTDVFTHPSLAGYSGVRHNLGATPGQHIVESDSAFTAITYGLGNVESYGYNAGTLVKNLNALPNITNTLGNGTVSEYTCVNAPFRFNILISSIPQKLVWRFSTISTLTPNTDVVQNNPVSTGTVVINGRIFYRFSVAADYTFSSSGVYNIPIVITDTTTIEGCDNSLEMTLAVTVIAAPIANFTTNSTGCFGTPIQFNGTGVTANGTAINTWNWTFGDNTTGLGQSITHSYPAPGTYDVNLSIIAADGCIGDTVKQIILNALPAVAVVSDSMVVCGNSPVEFQVSNPDPGSTYTWYTTATGGTAVFTGPNYTVPAVTGTVTFYVQATTAAGCISERKRVIATLLPDLPIPVVTVDSIGTDRITFRWNAVPGALTYEVSTNNGTTWLTPSSGTSGLSHTVTGLMPLDEISLIVRAKGSVDCQVSVSLSITARTLPDQIYIPNAFTPNGDGLNDILLVYGYTVQSLRFIVFNQWGEKIFESTNQATGWNGTHKGKMQPSGVYMYVCQVTLKDGSTVLRKGSINLVR